MPQLPDHDPIGSPRPVSREQIEQALHLWRDAAHQLERQPWHAGWREDYERSIAAGLVFLRRYTTMPELVRSYFADVTDEKGNDPFEQAVHALPSGRILNYGIVEDASYFRRAQQLIAESAPKTAPGDTTMSEDTGQAQAIEVDPYLLAELERAPLSEPAREELRRRMLAGEDVYTYQSGGPAGRWVVWLNDEPGRVHKDVWEAIVDYWQARAASKHEGSNSELVAKYGLQGPPQQRAAAARLSALAMLRGEYPEHARQIVLYAYHEADSYLRAHPSSDRSDGETEDS